MSANDKSRANALAGLIFLLGLLALSWPLLEIPLSSCQDPGLAFSADFLARCAVAPLIWIYAIWLLLLLALWLRSRRRRSDQQAQQRPPHG